jgi:aconitate hydratase
MNAVQELKPHDFIFENTDGIAWQGVDLPLAVEKTGKDLSEMPYVIRIFLENLLRSHLQGKSVSIQEIDLLFHWSDNIGQDVPLFVTRVILPDSSGVPVLQDIAAMRDALSRMGGEPSLVGMVVPVDLIIDHSLQVDHWGRADSLVKNMQVELQRNRERYSFIDWAQQAFKGLRVFPPGSGIIHQVNLERIASVVTQQKTKEQHWVCPEFVIGGDSHTPMINALGVLGWGVGGIDAEAALLGLAYSFPIPEVVGVKLTGSASPLVWTTDIALLVTERLRHEGVTNCAVEFFGPVAQSMPIPERATLANMAPEYGATCGFFPVDDLTLQYLKVTGREQSQIELVQAYCKRVGLFRSENSIDPHYSRVIEIDISQAVPSLAGPRRPQDRLPLPKVAADFSLRMTKSIAQEGFGPSLAASVPGEMPSGAVVIAAITSCTNTSNPEVMIAAGLVARNAVKLGIAPPSWVKTSLAPGSPAVITYLKNLGLMEPLEKLGFYLIGFGCTTCGGKSGPLSPEVAQEIESRELVTAAVVSGNRNFPGRIHKLVRANYIGAPSLVVAYALAGKIEIDFEREPIGVNDQGEAVYFKDIQPSKTEVNALVEQMYASGDLLLTQQASPLVASDWSESDQVGSLYKWDLESQYLREPPFFSTETKVDSSLEELIASLKHARVLAAFGDSLTTDHISPGSEIPVDTPAGQYLISKGVSQKNFNSYIARRGNFEVMVRGTFANVRIRNALTPEKEGGFTIHFPSGRLMTIFDAAQEYLKERVGGVILAGKEYGTGSSRDWAAKGTALLGVKAVIAQSYERIHRANLIGMGVLPLRFDTGVSWQSLGLDGTEAYAFENIKAGVLKGEPIQVTALHAKGHTMVFQVLAQVNTTAERELLLVGGIPQSIIESMKDKRVG